MIQSPPPWLAAWRRMCSRLKKVMFETIKAMMHGHQLGSDAKGGDASTSTTCGGETVPSQLPAHIVQEVRERPRPLRHMQSVRKQLEMESRAAETHLPPMPLPSRATISEQVAAGASPKANAAYRARFREVRVRPKTRTMTPPSGQTENGPWTEFWKMDGAPMERLSFNVMEQMPPFAHTPRSLAENAFLNERIFLEKTMRLQGEEDEKRWDMMELGVVSREGDPIYIWEEVQS